MTTQIQLVTDGTMYKVLNATVNIIQSIFRTRVHCVVLKGTLSKMVYLFFKQDAHMRGYPGEIDPGTGTFLGVDEILKTDNRVRLESLFETLLFPM